MTSHGSRSFVQVTSKNGIPIKHLSICYKHAIVVCVGDMPCLTKTDTASFVSNPAHGGTSCWDRALTNGRSPPFTWKTLSYQTKLLYTSSVYHFQILPLTQDQNGHLLRWVFRESSLHFHLEYFNKLVFGVSPTRLWTSCHVSYTFLYSQSFNHCLWNEKINY